MGASGVVAQKERYSGVGSDDEERFIGGCVFAEFAHFEIAAGDLDGAVRGKVGSALAVAGEHLVRIVVEFEAEGDEHDVDVHGGVSFEFKDDLEDAGGGAAMTQKPATGRDEDQRKHA